MKEKNTTQTENNNAESESTIDTAFSFVYKVGLFVKESRNSLRFVSKSMYKLFLDHVRVLKISKRSDVACDDLTAFLEKYSDLQTLDLMKTINVNPSTDIPNEVLTKLVNLSLGHTKVLSNDADNNLCSNFESLNLQGAGITNPFAGVEDGTLTKLKTLDLSGWRHISDEGVRKTTLVCPNLHELSLRGTQVTNPFSEFNDGELTQLKHLDLRGCVGLTDKGAVKALRVCPNLEIVDFGETHVTNPFSEFKDGALDKLERLKLKGCSEFKDAGASDALRVCLNIKTIDLSETKVTHALTDDVWNQYQNPNPEGRPFKGTKMETIFLNGCENVADYWSAFIPMLFPGLKALSLVGTNVMNPMLGVADSLYSSLKFLSLSRCENVDDDGVQKVVAVCPNLQFLRLDKTNITDPFAPLEANALTEIKSLSMKKCSKLIHKGVENAVRACPHLQKLYLFKCRNISGFYKKATVAEIRASLRKEEQDDSENALALTVALPQEQKMGT